MPPLPHRGVPPGHPDTGDRPPHGRRLHLRPLRAHLVPPLDDDLEPLDTVRVDLPDATLYGTAWQVEPDRVQVRGTGGAWLRWVERWRVHVY
ncbi:hypothetical protein L1856_22120 [Streptomyces sp. Tue 6430]|nr:hypothetical protein [Streptomyces sp. Tue 6430]